MRPSLRTLFLLALASGAVLAGESASFAQGYYAPDYGPPPAPPPSRRPPPRYSAPYYYETGSHQGFFLRLTAGVGYLYATESAGGETASYSGFGGTLGLAVGGAIAPNLIIFGEILGTSARDVQVSYRNVSDYPGLDVMLFGFGPGIAYYLEPANVYLSATLAISKLSFSNTYDYYYDSYATEDTDWGFGGSFLVGKEWWIARRLGIGVAGQLHLASMTDSYNHTRLTATAFSVLFSATFN
jgi:hypothetical protein